MVNTNANPEVRFAGFTENWEESNLEIKTSKIGDGLHGTPRYIEDGGVYFINGNNLESGNIKVTSETKQVSETQMSENDKSLGLNTLLISINGTIGNLALYNGEKVMLGKSVAYLNLVNLNRQFTYLLLQSPKIQNYFSNSLTGSTIKNLGLKAIRETKILFPSPTEQKLIGNFFENLYILITDHQQKHIKLKALKKAMLSKMFPQEGQTVPEIRFKGFSGEWEEKSLGHLGYFIKGKGLNKNAVSSSGKYECVLYGHLYTEYDMLIEKINYYTNNASKAAIKSQFGDILFPSSDTTPTGLARATCIEKEGVILGGDINVLRPNNLVLGRFLSFNINANRNKLIPLIKGIAVRHIYNSDLETVKISIPNNIEEQQKIGNYFKSLDTLISDHEIQIEKLNNLKKAFLAKMFI